MSPEQLLKKLDDLKIKLVWPENPQEHDVHDIPIVEDGRRYNHDASFRYKSDIGLSFGYYSDETNWYINAPDDMPTVEGLKSGDSVKKMKSIYGDNYRKNVEDYNVCQYYNGDVYLNIYYNDDIVSGWSMKKWSGINDD